MMWLLWMIPDDFLLWVVNTVLIVGAVSSFVAFFLMHRLVLWVPALAPWHLPIQILSAILLVAGIYFKGGYGVEMEWREKVRAMEEKVRIAEEKAAEKNIEIQEKIVEKVRVVKDTQVVIREKLVEVEKVIDAECKVVPEAVEIHNAAAKNREPKLINE